MAAGRSNGDIGAALFISTKTASVHVSNILAKLGVTSRGEAAALSYRAAGDVRGRRRGDPAPAGLTVPVPSVTEPGGYCRSTLPVKLTASWASSPGSTV